MELKNKVIMITGASKGLGRELALAFAEAGAHLAICARSEDPLFEVKKETERYGNLVLAVTADASVPQDMERFAALTEVQFGRVDVLINNASILGPSPMPLLIDYPEKDFEEVIRVNSLSPFLITKRVLPLMLLQNEGQILNVTSEAGHIGYEGWGAYGISKFAVEGLTQTWAAELMETGIRVNMVDPGEMNTEMHARAVPDCEYDLLDPKEVAKVFVHLVKQQPSLLQGVRISAAELLEKGVVK